MTTTPALQVLIDAWSRTADGNEVGDAAVRLCAVALERTLQRHPVVPCDELSQLASEMLDTGHREVTNETCSQWLRDTVAKYTPKPPNPHPQGTYLWAKEEFARGKRVRRNCGGLWRFVMKAKGLHPYNAFAVCSETGDDWSQFLFVDTDFTATDWEVVS